MEGAWPVAQPLSVVGSTDQKRMYLGHNTQKLLFEFEFNWVS